MSPRTAAETVLAFARESDGLQRHYAPQLEAARQTGDQARVLEAFREEMEDVYGRFLTPRRRSYYFGLSVPGSFEAVETASDWTTEEGGGVALVTVRTRPGALDFRFRLRCREGVWRIDSFRQRPHGREDRPWAPGCF